MAKFTDSMGRDWDLTITAPLGMRIRQQYDPKFLIGLGHETLERIAMDPVLFACILYVLCDRQRVERKITEEDFYAEISGPAFDSALPALGEAIINFTRDPSIRRALQLVIHRTQALTQKAMALLETEATSSALDDLEAKYLAEMQRRLTPSASATDTPVSAG